MISNLDHNKQPEEDPEDSRKLNKLNHPSLNFDNTVVNQPNTSGWF